jgi:5-methylcytosine-specific restriction enzyme subunit McrC
LRFQVDLVLYDHENRPRLVLDTKYKTGRRPAPADVQQITTYARVRGCREAVLVYPEAAERALDVNVGDVRLRTVAFALAGDLEANGRSFLRELSLS